MNERCSRSKRHGRTVLSAILFLSGLWAYLTVVELQDPHSTTYVDADSTKRYFSPAPPGHSHKGLATRGESGLPSIH